MHLSDQEKATIISIFKIIELKLKSKLDDFSQGVIISQIELLLNYSNRFYKKVIYYAQSSKQQPATKAGRDFGRIFNNEKSLSQGIPTVQFISESLNISPSYLSDMLRSLTRQNAQQHIYNKLIEKAKENYQPQLYPLAKLPIS